MKLLSLSIGLIVSRAAVDNLPVHRAAKAMIDAPSSDTESENQEAFREEGAADVKKTDRRRPIEPRCEASVDLVINQDTTMSFSIPQLRNINDYLSDVIDTIESAYPESRFGLARFEDIPLFPYGSGSNTCYELLVPLSDDKSQALDAHGALLPRAGGDLPESQYTALMASAQDPNVNWRGAFLEGSGKTLMPVVKVILTITDGIPHMAGDGWARDLVPNPGSFPPQCSTFDYPSTSQVKLALDTRENVAPAFIVRSPAFPLIPDAKPVYDEFINSVMNGRGHVTEVPSYYRDIYDELFDAIDQAISDVCEDIIPDVECTVSDYLVVRDLSQSTGNNLGQFKSFVESKFGVTPDAFNLALVSHSDKPVEPFGYPISMDFCFWKHTNLTTYDEFMTAFIAADDDVRSGGDFPENQVDAIIQGLNKININQPDSECNCVMVLTDAFHHIEGDFGTAATYDPAQPDCVGQDYPSVSQLVTALNSENVGCLIVGTDELVESYWLDFGEELADAGFSGTYTVELLEKIPRSLTEIGQHFNPQPKHDLRHLEARV